MGIERFMTPQQAATKLNVSLEELEKLGIKKHDKLGSTYYEIAEVNRVMNQLRNVEIQQLMGEPRHFLEVLNSTEPPDAG